MAIRMRRTTRASITESGMYWAEILSVSTYLEKNGNKKVILELCPHDFETQEEYRKMEVWMADDEERDARVGTLLNALPEYCESNLEHAVGKAVGIKVSVHKTSDRTFLNIIDFFEVTDNEEEESEENDDFDNEEEELSSNQDDFISSETRKNQKNRRTSKE